MSDNNATKIICAFMLTLGLIMNGCAPSSGINENAIIDERELSKGLVEAACYLDGRMWQYGACK